MPQAFINTVLALITCVHSDKLKDTQPCVSCLLSSGTIYEGTTNVQLSTMAKFIDKEYDNWRLDADHFVNALHTLD